MLKVPTLSIIIPAYNVAPFIRAAAESALNQTFHDLEVIVVNDGSTDDTWEILRSLREEGQDARLNIVNKPNGGPSSARNAGIRVASGKYIGFLDADDLWGRDKAAKQIAVMEADASIAFTFSHSQYITEQGELTGCFTLSEKSELHAHDLIHRNYVGNGSTPIIRRDCIDLAGPFREDFEWNR
jgi:glycosyltransferase involved in cell wall biosynthesis